MDAYPFCVFKRNDRPCFLVKFKDEAGNYLPPVSTKKETKAEAMQVAFKWLRDGIPQKKSAVRISDLSLKACRAPAPACHGVFAGTLFKFRISNNS